MEGNIREWCKSRGWKDLIHFRVNWVKTLLIPKLDPGQFRILEKERKLTEEYYLLPSGKWARSHFHDFCQKGNPYHGAGTKEIHESNTLDPTPRKPQRPIHWFTPRNFPNLPSFQIVASIGHVIALDSADRLTPRFPGEQRMPDNYDDNSFCSHLTSPSFQNISWHPLFRVPALRKKGNMRVEYV